MTLIYDTVTCDTDPDPLRHKKPSGTSKPPSVDKLSQQKQQQWQNKSSSNSSSEVRGDENEATSTVANRYRSGAVVTNHNSVSSSTSGEFLVASG